MKVLHITYTDAGGAGIAAMRIHKSAEDYLEMILRLTEEKGYARSADIAMGLGVSKPSVSVAMKQLREGNYIVMDKDNYISLTDTGMEIAHRIYERHKVLTRMLTMIGVDEKTAEDDACKVEHDISVQTFIALKEQLEKMEARRAE
jgi:Mn-dependent DtxR family transcriptional regulator